MSLPLELDDVPEPTHDCDLDNRVRFGGSRPLVKIDHPDNSVDWSGPFSSQSYQVYQCTECGDYWGVRYQYDAGTGADDHWHRFGPNLSTVKRHY